MAGLLADDFAPLAAFPVSQWHDDDRPAHLGLVAYSCGGSLGIGPGSDRPGAAPNSLFNPFKEPSTAMLGGMTGGVNHGSVPVVNKPRGHAPSARIRAVTSSTKAPLDSAIRASNRMPTTVPEWEI
jgi:hypothetical protein